MRCRSPLPPYHNISLDAPRKTYVYGYVLYYVLEYGTYTSTLNAKRNLRPAAGRRGEDFISLLAAFDDHDEAWRR